MLAAVDDKGIPMPPILVAEADTEPARVRRGFSPAVIVYVYPAQAPCMILCFFYKDKHYHCPVAVNTATEVLRTIRKIMTDQESVNDLTELLFRRTFDVTTDNERLMMEVTSANGKEIH